MFIVYCTQLDYDSWGKGSLSVLFTNVSHVFRVGIYLFKNFFKKRPSIAIKNCY